MKCYVSLQHPMEITSINYMSFIALVVTLLCVTTFSKAQIQQNCLPNSCGNIIIKYPFRLKTYPEKCGEHDYELECENGVDNNVRTILYLHSKKYHVQSIEYEYSRSRIHLLDPGTRNSQCPFFPVNSLSEGELPYPFSWEGWEGGHISTPVVFVRCSREVNSSIYVEAATSCGTNASSSLQEYYSYVLLGEVVRVVDLDYSCMIELVGWVSNDLFPGIDNTSFSSILDAMAKGFSLYWDSWRITDSYNVSPEPDPKRYKWLVWIWHRLTGIWYTLPSSRYLELDPDYPFGKRIYPGVKADLLIASIISLELAVLVITPRFMCGVLCLMILLMYKCRKRHLSADDFIEEFLQGQNNFVAVRYKYSDVKKITNNFKEKLGEGGYGSVFKGKLRSGILVAVKMMHKSKASGHDFMNEVATIGRIHHVNVVQLIGFCVEGSKRALIFEYMSNGSLEKYIFSQEEMEKEEMEISLSYDKMFEISLGVARGINYLHRGGDMQILHFDIKPHNILLDDNFTPKISDFGLAKLYSIEDSIVSLTAARGTMGYMAPELFYKNIGRVSYKADVYSYGMLLMEMAGRRRNLNLFVENQSQMYFPSWVYDQFNEGKEVEIMGDVSGEERKMVKKMILVALWCIQMAPADRPPMSKIVEMLEGNDEHLEMPPKPFLYQAGELPTEDYEIHANDNELPLLSSE